VTNRAWGDDHLTQIRQAAARIQNHVRRTPLLGNDISTGLLVKPESLQVTGSFKARGAFNAVLSLLEREPDVAGVVTHSSGNHGQALARAAQAAGLPATIVVPQGVTPAKIEGIRSFGATVVSEDVTFDNREAIAERIARAQRLRLIHPFDDWDVIHGAGTVGLEILEDVPAPGAVVVPVGGGGQISGIALALSVLSPETAVIGVEPDAADDAAGDHQRRRGGDLGCRHRGPDHARVAEPTPVRRIDEGQLADRRKVARRLAAEHVGGEGVVPAAGRDQVKARSTV